MREENDTMTKNEDVSWISPKTRKASIRGFSTEELISELKSRHELCPCLDEMAQPVCMCVTTTKSLVKEFLSRDGIGSIDIECADGVATIVVVKWWEI